MAAATTRDGKYSQSHEEEDDDDIVAFTEEDIQNDPSKRILWAAEKNKMDVVMEILTKSPELVDSLDKDWYTPLHRASYNNHLEVAKVLIEHKANVCAKTKDDWQPLHSAAFWYSLETAQLLLDNGAEVNGLTKGNLTPLHIAASNPGKGKMIELLMSNPNTDISMKSVLGETAKQVCEKTCDLGHLFERADSDVNQLAPSTPVSKS